MLDDARIAQFLVRADELRTIAGRTDPTPKDVRDLEWMVREVADECRRRGKEIERLSSSEHAQRTQAHERALREIADRHCCYDRSQVETCWSKGRDPMCAECIAFGALFTHSIRGGA